MKTRKHSSLFIRFAIPTLISAAAANAAGNNCHVYQVNLQGTTAIGEGSQALATQQFSVMQYAIFRETGFRGHPFEFALISGRDLNGSPQVGLIELATNSRFAHNPGMAATGMDLAVVGVQNGNAVFKVDSDASMQMPQPNVFVAPGYASVQGGMGGLCYLPNSNLCSMVRNSGVLSASYIIPRSGSGYFRLTDGTGSGIMGEVNIVGSSLDNANFQGMYRARFTGRYLQDTPCQ